ncbi:MAG: HEAT repeat domain-containing protein [Prevotella sp.]|nr:HEAT repeat domain-containing protein [Prevotella sp.]
MMKKVLFSFAILALAATMTACGNKSAQNAESAGEVAEVNDDSPAMRLLNSVPFTEEGLVSMVTTPEKGTLTADEYEAMYLAYSKVPIDEKTCELEKNFVSKARTAAFKNRKLPENSVEILKNLMSNASPQVRGQAITAATGKLFGAKNSEIANDLSALQNEKDPYVLKCGVEALSNELKDPEVAKFVFGLVENESPFVRRKVAIAVGNSWSKGVDGVKDAALKLMADKDENTRKLILGGVGKLADESFIPELVKVLDDPAQEKFHGDAVRSLSTMWLDYPFHKNTSKAAYDATMNYLKKTPRTNKVPAWAAFATFSTVAEKEIGAWKAKATYFKPAEFAKVLTDAINDPETNWLAAAPAAKAIKALCSKSDLENMRKAIEANSALKQQKQILDVIDKELK